MAEAANIAPSDFDVLYLGTQHQFPSSRIPLIGREEGDTGMSVHPINNRMSGHTCAIS
jgi:hypothetical protein